MKFYKLISSILVFSLMLVMVPMQKVYARPDFVLIEDDHISKYMSSFEIELTSEEGVSFVDSYGASHEIYLGEFRASEKEDYAILTLEYSSDEVDDKFEFLVLETLKPRERNTVSSQDQAFYGIIGKKEGTFEFEYSKAVYNSEYLYFYVGVYDTRPFRKYYAKVKAKNPYHNDYLENVLITPRDEIAIGESVELSAEYVPVDTKIDKTLIWESSDESIATVDEHGVVTGVGVGRATITATTVNGKSDICLIDVGYVIENLALEKEEYSFVHPKDFTLVLEITPSIGAAHVDDIVWEISDTSVVAIGSYASSGTKNFKTVGPGSATITAKTAQGVSVSCVVNVDAPIYKVHISSRDYLEVRQDYQLDLGKDTTISPSNTNYDKTLTWKSSDESVAMVDANGVVTGIEPGEVTITATAPNGIYDEQKIRVLPRIVIDSIRIGVSSLDLFAKDVYGFSAYIEPSSTTISKALTWTSSDENVAKVEVVRAAEAGYGSERVRIHAIGSGSCVITVTSVNGISNTITVNVSEGAIRIFGDNRYETAFKTADALKSQLKRDKFNNIIVASGTGFADALAGSYLAAETEAPILMTDKKQENIDNLVNYINENLVDGGTVYILGGTAAVSDQVEKALSNYRVKRLAGNDRYETNLKILKETNTHNKKLLVCTGTNFADSLSVSATGLPILLVGNRLSESQRKFLATYHFEDVYIIGGNKVISDSMAYKIDDLLLDTYLNFGDHREDISAQVYRISGNNRYETSTKVANKFFPDAKKAVLAYAMNYPDGLSGGALAHALNAPLLLTDGSVKNYTITSEFTNTRNIVDGYVLGGNALVTDDAVCKIFGNSK